MLVKKLRKARESKKAKTGRGEGIKLYGHYPDEAKIIKRIKQLYRKPRDEKCLFKSYTTHFFVRLPDDVNVFFMPKMKVTS